jgi:magnesium-transporting ATPase (P-type)
VIELWQTLGQLGIVLGKLIVDLLALGLQHALLIFWIAWWLWGTNWRKVWPTLAAGAWAPGVLLCVVAALVWSGIAPGEYSGLGFVTVPNFWWQLGAVALLAAVTLFCGWLQGVFDWTPPEISLEPPAPSAAHHHAHH